MSDVEADARAARVELEHLLEADAVLPTLDVRFLDTVESYTALLLDANRTMNLTRLTRPEQVARLHLLDALAALPLLDARPLPRALDLGSGGGVPGIVLALARPLTSWTLVDAESRKATALRAFVAALDLPRVEVIAARAEELGRRPEHREAHDLVTARACARLAVLAEYALPLLAIGGRLIAWKGPIGDEELAAGRAASARLGGGDLEVRPAGLAALGDHCFVVIDKVEPTPAEYPRRPGVPSRRPLGQ